MEQYSSKICNKCFSPQEPHARFCDHCGKRFASTAATDGNISINTKTFLKRQVAETRPFFWLCVIIVGMLGVFGFAQAGMYIAGSAGQSAPDTQTPSAFVSNGPREAVPSQQTTEQATQAANDGLLDLNNSVFEMRDHENAAGTHVAAKPKPVARAQKTQTQAEEKTESVDTVTIPAWEQPDVPAAPKPTAVKPEENDSAPRRYTRGPMGGCFYISASGSKHYVDRGMCN
jgi:hypothetical protein